MTVCCNQTARAEDPGISRGTSCVAALPFGARFFSHRDVERLLCQIYRTSQGTRSRPYALLFFLPLTLLLWSRIVSTRRTVLYTVRSDTSGSSGKCSFRRSWIWATDKKGQSCSNSMASSCKLLSTAATLKNGSLCHSKRSKKP